MREQKYLQRMNEEEVKLYEWQMLTNKYSFFPKSTLLVHKYNLDLCIRMLFVENVLLT
jgi:hypothetical protein